MTSGGSTARAPAGSACRHCARISQRFLVGITIEMQGPLADVLSVFVTETGFARCMATAPKFASGGRDTPVGWRSFLSRRLKGSRQVAVRAKCFQLQRYPFAPRIQGTRMPAHAP